MDSLSERGVQHLTLAQENLRDLAEEQRREGQRRELFGAFDSAEYTTPTTEFIDPDTAIYQGIPVEVTDPKIQIGKPVQLTPEQLRTVKEQGGAVALPFSHLDLIRRINTETFEDVAQEVYDEAFNLLVERQKKYGPKNIEQQGVYGLLVRMRDDKISRIQRALNGSVVNGEIVLDDINLGGEEGDTLADAYLDLANYALISLILLRGKWGKPLAAEVGFDE